MEESPIDIAPILEAASDFASYPGIQTDASSKEFLDRFPLPQLFSVLQAGVDVSGQATIVTCLDRIFKTKYGSTLLLQYMPFLQGGLRADLQTVKCLACKAVSYIIANNEDGGTVMGIIVEYDIYPILIDCLLHGDEETSAASIDAIKNIAKNPEGIGIIFPSDIQESIHLENIAARCSSLGRIRILSLIKELFTLSSYVASAVYEANLLKLFEAEINKRDDLLSTLSAMELLYELVDSPHSSQFLLKTTLLQMLIDTISNTSVDSILRSRAMLISGRLLSSTDTYSDFDESRVNSLLLAIDERLKLLEGQNMDECESALEALGQIGTTIQGAILLLTGSSHNARHMFEAAFGRQGRGKQLAALHALGDICGASRPEGRMMLTDPAEKSLRHLFYAAASSSAKLTISGLLLSVLQQDPEIRLAAYRLISVLVIRPWGLLEVISKQEIITIVTDANIEATKIGMEARFNCCAAICNALASSNMIRDANIEETAAKLQESVRRGPYLTKKRIEPQPLVMTAERF